jgi:hypothetical protein
MKNYIFSLLLIVAVFASLTALPVVAADAGNKTASIGVTANVTPPAASFEQATNLSTRHIAVTTIYQSQSVAFTVAPNRIARGTVAYSPPYSRCFTGFSSQQYARSGPTDSYQYVTQVARSGSYRRNGS